MSSVYFKCQIHMIKYITITTFQIQEIIFKSIQFRYVVYKTWGQINVFKHNRQGFTDNSPDPVRNLDVGTMTSQSHHTDRANSTGGAKAWLLKLQSKTLGDVYLHQGFPGTVTI